MIPVAYDVPDDGRRTRLAKTLERLGTRVQLSVFVIRCRRLADVLAEIETVVVPNEDNVRVQPIDTPSENKAVVLGLAKRAEFEPVVII